MIGNGAVELMECVMGGAIIAVSVAVTFVVEDGRRPPGKRKRADLSQRTNLPTDGTNSRAEEPMRAHVWGPPR